MSAQELHAQLDRLVDRLRAMALTRLDAPFEPEPTRTAAAIALAQRLADAAATLEDPGTPRRRQVPVVSAAAAGDLVAVTGGDVLAAAAGRAADEPVLAELADAVGELRQRL